MNKRSKLFKFIVLLSLAFLLGGLAFALLHHHEGGGSSMDCGACQFVRQIVLAFVLVFIAVFAGLERRPEFVKISESNPNSRSFSSPRKGRAPPFSF